MKKQTLAEKYKNSRLFKIIIINKIAILELGYSYWGGFIFELIAIETEGFEGTLLGLNFGKTFFNFDILFFHLEVSSPKY